MDLGILSCDDVSRCPRNCQICTACLRLLGCVPSGGTLFSTRNYLYIIVAAAAALAIVVGYYTVARRRRREQIADLEAHLMGPGNDSNPGDIPSQPPSSSLPASSIFDEADQRAWLAPDDPVDKTPSSAPVTPPISLGTFDEADEDCQDRAWLAPVTPPAQFEPSHRAAVESSGDSSSDFSSTGNFITAQPVAAAATAGSPDTTSSAAENVDTDDVVWLAPVP